MNRRVGSLVASLIIALLPTVFNGEPVGAESLPNGPPPAAGQPAKTHERTERFDREPDWDRRNNQAVLRRTIRQDFGFSPTAHAGGKKGEMGGFITPAAEPAY